MYGQKFGRKSVKPLRIETRLKNEKPKRCNARRLRGIYSHWSGRRGVQRNCQECDEKVGSANGRGHAVREENKEPEQLPGNQRED